MEHLHKDHIHETKKPEEHNRHLGHNIRNFIVKFWITLVLTVPIVIYSGVINLGSIDLFFSGYQYLILTIGSLIYFWGGGVFLKGAWSELKSRLPGMMTLIALAITSAYLYSVFSVLTGKGTGLFLELATLTSVMLLGHWFEMKAVQNAEGSLKELAKLLPDTAEVAKGDAIVKVPLKDLRQNDVVLIKPGGKVPADGEVIEGQSEINEAVITGEARLILKNIGDKVIAGTINADGSLRVKITNVGERTFLAAIVRLVAEAQASKSRLQTASDKAAFYLTLIAVSVGLATFFGWIIQGSGMTTAVDRLVAVLVIACPHALGLAVPLVASISTTIAADNGLFVKKRLALEAARNIDIILFDKTGTLTKGEFGVETIIPASSFKKEEVLLYAASVDQNSNHPLASAIVAEAQKNKLEFLKAVNFLRLPGKGSYGLLDGREVLVGNLSLLEEKKIAVPAKFSEKLQSYLKAGKTITYVAAAGNFIGSIVLTDVIRKEAREALTILKKMALKTAMITGDAEGAAAWVAGELGLDEYFSQVFPDDKSKKVKELQKRGLKVAMVGDGVNDAPALSQADLGIAIGAGTNIAIESAGIILVKNDPRDIPKIIRLSRLTYAKMMQNLFWATGYNVVAIPLATGAFISRGITLEPTLAAVFMSLSTIIVVVNALLLKTRKRIV